MESVIELLQCIQYALLKTTVGNTKYTMDAGSVIAIRCVILSILCTLGKKFGYSFYYSVSIAVLYHSFTSEAK
jgi:hypothetical protein